MTAPEHGSKRQLQLHLYNNGGTCHVTMMVPQNGFGAAFWLY